jgi:hypothetical protein
MIVPKHIRDKMSPEDRARYEAAEIAAGERYIASNERREQKILNNWLSLQLAERKLWPINPRSDKASTIRVGHPDYTIFLAKGRLLLMEMKVAGGTLSQEQLTAIGILSELGHEVAIPASAYEAINLVKKFL